VGDVGTVKEGRSLVWREDPRDEIKESGLSGSIGSDEACDGAFLDLKIDSYQR
jgi:hypothetical protein